MGETEPKNQKEFKPMTYKDEMSMPWFEAKFRAERWKNYSSTFIAVNGRKPVNNNPDASDIIAQILGDDIPPIKLK